MFDHSQRAIDQAHDIRIIGAPFDGTVSFRPGARFGPQAIRTASDGLETWSPVLDADVQDLRFADAGDLDLPPGDTEASLARIEQATADALAASAMPFLLGGEHLVTLPAVRAVHAAHPELVVVQLDAHADQRTDYLGVALSHACVMRRIGERVGAANLKQLGIRSGTRAEYAWMRAHHTLTTFRAQDLAQLRAWIGARPVYLTVDLDVFDPSCLPGTGTPEPGGIDWWTFQRLLGALRGCTFAGMDIVELAPQWDPSGCSSVLAAKCLREMLLLAGESMIDA
ncbi:MAG: agmatinase [Zetaproteobacteria bacterium]|nr:MAG: agmatinase [Zetaproteobacteria bacterium]